MTGFEHTAAVGIFYENQLEEGLKTISDIRARYDGKKKDKQVNVKISVLHGSLELKKFKLGEEHVKTIKNTTVLKKNDPLEFLIKL